MSFRHPKRRQAKYGDSVVARWLSHVFWYGLPTLIVLLVLGYVALIVAWHVQRPVLPVRGTSMNPVLHAGDLVFVKSADTMALKKGDIIAFNTTQKAQDKYGVPATYVHRIFKVHRIRGGGRMFETKGDNVPGPDPFYTSASNVVGKYVTHVRRAGYPLIFFRSRQGEIFLVAVALIMLAYFLVGFWERRQLQEEGYQFTLATLVQEARTLTTRMEGVTATPRGPPPAAEASTALPPKHGPRLLDVEGTPPADAVLCSHGCHILLPGARFDPHTGEPVEGVAEPIETAAQPLLPAVPAAAPPSGVDFEQLERELHETVASTGEVRDTMRQLLAAVGEYGEHLRSHTAVMQGLAATTDQLRQATVEMRDTLGSVAAGAPTTPTPAPPAAEPVALVLEGAVAAIVQWQVAETRSTKPAADPLLAEATRAVSDLLALAMWKTATVEDAEAVVGAAEARVRAAGEDEAAHKLTAVLFGARTTLRSLRAH